MKKILTITTALLAFSLLFVFSACRKGGDDTIEVTKLTLDVTEASLRIGETVKLTATVEPEDATDIAVTWISSSESIATVADGTVTAVATGKATVTAKAGRKTATCEIVVLKESDKIMIGTREYVSIATAVAAAEAGDTIEITNGEYTVDETITIDKKITLLGESGHTMIKTSGTQMVFTVTAEDVVFDGISITKTDKEVSGSYAMMSMQANGFTVKNGTFTAQYADGDSEVTRAIVPYAGVSGYVIEGNRFSGIRQPAYLEGAGTVKNNHVDGTRGWVVCCNYAVTFEDNTFGSNAVDIAIIPNGETENKYDEEKTIAISTANGGCFVQNQVLGIDVKNGAKVTE